MAIQPDDAPALDTLQFDAPADGPAGPPVCAECGGAIADSYYEVNGHVVCASCKAKFESRRSGGSAAARLGRATLFGFGAAIAGAGLYYAILALTGYEIDLVAVAVGWLVGRAVHVGSGGRGGWGYQTLAVGLTYLAIVSTYIPFLATEFSERQPAAEASAPAAPEAAPAAADVPAPEAGSLLMALGALVLIAVAAPFLAGMENVIGVLIIGFALYQAWKMNARVTLVFNGPYAIGAPGATTAAGE
jgi:hypothetical protein